MDFTQEHELVIVIPAYEPDSHLINLLLRLNLSFVNFKVIIVDDGSQNAKDIFTRCNDFKNVTILTHQKNLGKGEALKTAFRYIKTNIPNSLIITADSDGQHKCEDIKNIYNIFLNYKDSLILGSRKFEGDVPKKSAFGNNVSQALIRLCHNKHLNDTQTGLRAFSYDLLDFMISIPGSRYEYEMNMISESIRQNINIIEVPIQTVYINQNRASHFRPVKDFTKLCLTILKYCIPYFISLFAGILSFEIFTYMLTLTPYFCILLAYPVALVIYLVISRTGILFGRKNLFYNRKLMLRQLIYYVASQMISIIITLELYLAIQKLSLSFIISLIANTVLISLANYFILTKSQFITAAKN